MGLELVVDGYNLIRTSPSLSRSEAYSLEEGRLALLSRLTAYKAIKGWPITVVFDGSDTRYNYPSKKNLKGVRVIFSRQGKTADDEIVHLASQKGPRLVVVTSDRSLSSSVERYGAMTIDSADFEMKMELAYHSDLPLADPETTDPRPSLSTKKKGPKRRSSKKERKKKARLKKI